jgi:hypothetical protein
VQQCDAIRLALERGHEGTHDPLLRMRLKRVEPAPLTRKGALRSPTYIRSRARAREHADFCIAALDCLVHGVTEARGIALAGQGCPSQAAGSTSRTRPPQTPM